MDIAFIESLIELAKKTGIAGLEYEADGEMLRISVTPDGEVVASNGEAPAIPAQPAAIAPPAPGHHRITSGMMGTFYRASAPGAEPYVKPGDRIEEGQVLGLIEAMKMLTPIEADRAGTVKAVLVEDGAAVERGTLLFEIGE